MFIISLFRVVCELCLLNIDYTKLLFDFQYHYHEQNVFTLTKNVISKKKNKSYFLFADNSPALTANLAIICLIEHPDTCTSGCWRYAESLTIWTVELAPGVPLCPSLTSQSSWLLQNPQWQLLNLLLHPPHPQLHSQRSENCAC